MREFWIRVEKQLPPENVSEIITAASEICATMLVTNSSAEEMKAAGLRVVSVSDGDILLVQERDLDKVEQLRMQGKPLCARMTVRSSSDEEKALKAANTGFDFLLISCPDWKVIPLENLIARSRGRVKLIAEVSSIEEAKLALETLEIGVDGIALAVTNRTDIEEAKRILNETDLEEKKIALVSARIVALRALSLGHRVCIDTCEIMAPGEGLLIGSQSSGLFLIQAEVQVNPHVDPRPFRVNAGPVSLYVMTSDNTTRYLSELKSGDEVQVVDREGRTHAALVGRIKIERRPMMLVETEVNGSRLKTIVQNAETIRFVTKDGSKAVTELKDGDEVLVYHQKGGRHFGTLVSEESVIER
ncbi:3-dehydroquinate synthase II [Candidatus Bathyarchaeota archaeon]|nr:3-dehydroquinate synthase II [Candidatus Bathyarchaeota archaeon]